MKQHTVGIDISKAHLDAHRLADGHAAQFDNDPAGFRALIDWIGTPVECIAYEATGPYHRDLEEALSKAKLPLAKVNPWQARRFAEATGSRAKTDAVDARKLAQMAASLDPRWTPAPSKTQRRLQELQTARDALIRQRTALLNRRQQLREPLLKQQNQTQINMFERHLRAIDRKMQQLIAADEARARKLEILTSIPGSRPPPPPVCWPRCPSWAPSAARPPPVWPGWPPFPASPGLGRAGPSSGADGRGRDGSCTCRRWPPCAGTPTWPR